MKLSHVKDKILLNDTKNLVMAERHSTGIILFHLKEIDKRKLYSDLKCTSLFDYCVRELGYSEGSAQRRIVAARMLEEIPEIVEKIETGKLTLSNISKVNQFFETMEEKKKAFIEIEGLSKKACEKKLFQMTGKVIDVPVTPKRVSEDKMQVAIVLKDATVALIEKVKGHLGIQDMDEVIEFAMNAALREIEKKKFKQTEKPKSPPPAKVGRTIHAYVKREVFKRDQKCVNCGSTHNLNFDHREAYALGGSAGMENIRLLCFHCNQRARIRARL